MSGFLEVLGWSLLHSVWQGALIGAGLWLVLRVAPSSAVRVRYAAGVLALAALLALPALNYGHTMRLWTGHRSWVVATADGILRTELAERGRADVGAVREELRRRQAREWPGTAVASADPLAGEPARAFGLLWLVAVALLGVRLGVEQRRALALAESGTPDAAWRSSAAVVAARLGLGRPVRVRVTERVDVPALVGWRWPVVLVPVAAARLGPEERDAVLAHELAHVRRGDYLGNLLQSAGEALLFYSPAAWWISARIREERECCCDHAAVAAASGGAARYVKALLSLETGRAGTRAALALHGGSLVRRVRRIHTLARQGRTGSRAAALAPLLLAGCVTIAVAAFTPEVAARRSAGALMAGDIEEVRFVVVRAGPSAPATPVPPATCTSTPSGERA